MSPATANAGPELAPAVEWEDPRDARVTWTLARLHYPRPITVLTQDLRRLSQDAGMSRADAALERPVERLQRRIHGYLYRGARPVELPADELSSRKRRAEARYVSLARRVGDLWGGMLPEIEALLAAFDAVPLERLDRTELATELGLATTRFARLWELHFLVMPPALTAMELFTELYRELFEGATQLDALRLLQGGTRRPSRRRARSGPSPRPRVPIRRSRTCSRTPRPGRSSRRRSRPRRRPRRSARSSPSTSRDTAGGASRWIRRSRA